MFGGQRLKFRVGCLSRVWTQLIPGAAGLLLPNADHPAAEFRRLVEEPRVTLMLQRGLEGFRKLQRLLRNLKYHWFDFTILLVKDLSFHRLCRLNKRVCVGLQCPNLFRLVPYLHFIHLDVINSASIGSLL